MVTVKENPNSETDFAVDLKELSSLIRSEVGDKLDHTTSNLDDDFMVG